MSRVLLALLIALPLSGQSSVEQRLTALEQQMRELKAENDALRRQLGAAVVPAPVVTKPETRQPPLTIGGLLQAQGEAGGSVDSRYTDGNDRFFLRRARVNLQGRFVEGFDFRIELDAAGSLSNATLLRAQLTDAWIAWTRYPSAQMRFGQFKTPFGYEQLFSDPRLLTPERSLASDRIAPGRQVGLQVGGDLLRQRLSYALGAFNGNGTNVNFNDDERRMVAGRLSGVLWKGKAARLTTGVNAYRSDDRTGAQRSLRRSFGADAQLTIGRGEIWAEVLRAGGSSPADGWYLQSGYFLVRDKLQGVVRFETFDQASRQTDTWLTGINYLIKGHDLKLQLHFLTGDDDNRVIARLQSIF